MVDWFAVTLATVDFIFGGGLMMLTYMTSGGYNRNPSSNPPPPRYFRSVLATMTLFTLVSGVYLLYLGIIA